MDNFTFLNCTKIIFGKNSLEQIPAEIKKYSNSIMLHYDGDGSKESVIKKYGLFDKLISLLKNERIEVLDFPGVKPNPRLSLARKGIEICREKSINFILAVGGGSAIDSSKTIALGVPNKADIWDICTGKANAEMTLPVGVVVTIASAGSEAGNGLVITNEDNQVKQIYNHEMIRPKFAVLNPELTFTVPPYQTSCGIADSMTHVFERYFTSSRDTDFTDKLCEGTIKTLIRNSAIVLNDPDNYAARAEIMLASTIANNDLLSMGRLPDWSCHRIQHELSAFYDIPHGAGLTIIYPAWMKHVYKKNLTRFAQFANKIWNIDSEFESLEFIALEGIKATERFFKALGLPTTLTELNIGKDRFEEMAKKCSAGKPLGNTYPLSIKDVVDIYELAL